MNRHRMLRKIRRENEQTTSVPFPVNGPESTRSTELGEGDTGRKGIEGKIFEKEARTMKTGPATQNGNLERGSAESPDRLVDCLNQLIRPFVGWGGAVSAHLETHHSQQLQIEQSLEKIAQRLSRLEANQETSERASQVLRLEIARILAQNSRLSQMLQSQNHDLDQLRLHADGSMRKIEQLTSDFIERHVTDPIFKERCGFTGNCGRSAGIPDAIVRG